MTHLKDCPFCGYQVSTHDPLDTIYPAGPDRNTDGSYKVIQVVCQVCSATVLGESRQEAIDNWNRRV